MLPAGAFLLVTVCHGLGAMAGAIVAMLVTKRGSLIPALVVGVFFTGCGIMNLSSLPHPAWFPFVDVPIYMIFAVIAGLVLKRHSDSPQAESTGDAAPT